jgi:hypothetical protein
MRTKEEVFAVLESYALSAHDRARTMGFLLGKGVIEYGEVVTLAAWGEPLMTFNEFYEWFEAEDELKVLEGLMNFLQDEQDKALEAGDAKKADELALYLGFLVDALELEYEEVEEDEAQPRDR